MSSLREVAQGLEQESKKHEKELVIEFGSDRILQYIGVYLLAFLAVVAKISELASSNLSCYPAGKTSVRGDFIKHASAYCWESSTVTSAYLTKNGSSCELNALDERVLLKDPSWFKALIKWMPYVMMLEVILFSLPSIWWHYRVGARLMGHMKFMQLLLGNIYETVKLIPNGIYRKGDAYDGESYYLNGWRGFEPQCYQEGRVSKHERRFRSKTKTGIGLGSACLVEGTESGNVPDEDVQKSVTVRTKAWLTKLVFGEMRDRHLFSMLCFENFSSLEHHPYILSVYKLSRTAPTDPKEADTLPKTQGILRLLCNKKNFCGRFLVKSYLMRHLFGTTVSLLVFAATIGLLYTVGSEGWNLDSFRCDVIYHSDICVICTIRRKYDMVAYLAVNLAVNVLYFVLSLAQWIFIRRSGNRATSYYFEEISDTGSVALGNA